MLQPCAFQTVLYLWISSKIDISSRVLDYNKAEKYCVFVLIFSIWQSAILPQIAKKAMIILVSRCFLYLFWLFHNLASTLWEMKGAHVKVNWKQMQFIKTKTHRSKDCDVENRSTKRWQEWICILCVLWRCWRGKSKKGDAERAHVPAFKACKAQVNKTNYSSMVARFLLRSARTASNTKEEGIT